MTKKITVFALVFSLVSIFTMQGFAYAMNQNVYENSNSFSRNESVSESIDIIDGVYYYFYNDKISQNIISISGTKPENIMVYYNDNEHVYNVTGFEASDVKFGKLEYFQSIVGEILSKESKIKKEYAAGISKTTSDTSIKMDNLNSYTLSAKSSNALNYFIGETGNAYNDNKVYTGFKDGKYIDIFESKTHDVSNSTIVYYASGITLTALAAIAGVRGETLKKMVKVFVVGGVIYVASASSVTTYHGTVQFYKDVDVQFATKHSVSKRMTYTFKNIQDAYTSLDFAHGSADDFYDNHDQLIQIALSK